MLHFPSPVNLTGWNTTGGLLGRKDERLFFSPPPFFSSSPSPTISILPWFLFLAVTPGLSCLFVVFSCLLYIYVYMGLDSYVMRHHFLMCWGIASVAWLDWAVLTHGRYISASWQLSNPLVISLAMSHNSSQLSHYSSVLAASSYMCCVHHLTVGTKNILSHVSNMWYVENILSSI